MKKISEEDFIKLLQRALDYDELNSGSSIENTEVWDSLGQLIIFTNVSRIVDGDEQVLNELNSLKSIGEIIVRLKEHNYII